MQEFLLRLTRLVVCGRVLIAVAKHLGALGRVAAGCSCSSHVDLRDLDARGTQVSLPVAARQYGCFSKAYTQQSLTIHSSIKIHDLLYL